MTTIDFRMALPLYGRWEINPNGNIAHFKSSAASDATHGLTLLPSNMDDGVVECDIQLPEVDLNCGAFVIFRANGQSSYYAAGLGGWDSAYTVCEGRNLNLTRLAHAGSIANLVAGRTYKVRLTTEGQKLALSIDGVSVVTYDRLAPSSGTDRLAPVTGTGLGLFALRSTREALFGPFVVQDRRPNAFIAMQFSEPYNEVYRDAIRPLVEQIGYEPFRVDEKAGPGIILNDIWSHITESSVVIAEVSEPNPNVYYEIGVAHALQKPTVLLATRATKLPFDLGPHRCIFYDNTIPGRAKLLDSLRGSLTSLLGIPVRQ